ncbi:MAG: type II toxin-antitoxin system RelE/ParE family toxin [Nitrospirae bacterium]|nr:type II toxin-antitoxin system RelE/ParE family toxin [Nitrospirota bacterium]MBF0593311.1 type II toxin-antitoxin system RelE/ParE family toxin [Nitrospirota bacterium]
MSYDIFILRRAQKELSGLSSDTFKNMKKILNSLKDEPRPHGCRKLTRREGWRIRTGDYRIIYDIDDDKKQLTVLDIGHRKYIYR